MQVCCDLLDKMRSDWFTAGAMADLGQAALKKAAGKEKPDQSHSMHGSDVYAGSPVPLAATGLAATSAQNLLDANQIVSPPASSVLTPMPGTPAMAMGNNDMSPPLHLDPSISPDWLNFDNAFENFDAVLGSSGADLSMELLRPFNFEEFGSYEFPK